MKMVIREEVLAFGEKKVGVVPPAAVGEIAKTSRGEKVAHHTFSPAPAAGAEVGGRPEKLGRRIVQLHSSPSW